MSERDIQAQIQLAATQDGHRLLRNNVGALEDRNGRLVRYGLGTGSSDLIGWTRTGRFLAIEVKAPHGKPTDQQRLFIAAVQDAGGLAGIAHSVEEARAIWSTTHER